MSEKLFKFLLAQLRMVRILCQGKNPDDNKDCSGVIEIPIERLESFLIADDYRCPLCKTPFYLTNVQGKHLSPFAPLAESIKNLNAISDRVKIEFVIPTKD